MLCPHCGSPNNRVVNSRDAQNGTAIRRRRECLNCEERFTTFEHVEEIPVHVVKSDGKRERYDPRKVREGLVSACRKRPITEETVGEMVGRIESRLFGRPTKEITSREIGEIALAELRQVDEVAYIRFASVYRQFGTLDEFLSELNSLQRERVT
jgi:transcriptional repressor NrdR